MPIANCSDRFLRIFVQHVWDENGTDFVDSGRGYMKRHAHVVVQSFCNLLIGKHTIHSTKDENARL